MSSGQGTDLGGHVLAWAAAFLTGDREQALARLMEAREAWIRNSHDS